MNLMLGALQLYLPGVVRRRVMDELFRSTAAAFGTQTPRVQGLSHEERLLKYALFTRELAEKTLQDERRSSEVRARLFAAACDLGEQARRQLKVRSLRGVLAAGRVLYRVLGIEFCGDAGGGIEIPRCFFSRYYTGEVCRLISALDEGVVAGLSQGGRFIFEQRLTEGFPCCKARLVTRGVEDEAALYAAKEAPRCGLEDAARRCDG